MSMRLNIFLALACGLILANLYYTQTIIADIGASLQLGVSLADPARQGRSVGILASGVILGLVLSRPAASLMTGLFSWRFMSAFFMLLIGLTFIMSRVTRLSGF